MKLPVFTVERLSARMEIRTAGTVPMHAMFGIGSGGKKKDGSLMSAPLIVRRYRHERNGMENPARGCTASGGI